MANVIELFDVAKKPIWTANMARQGKSPANFDDLDQLIDFYKQLDHGKDINKLLN